MGWRDEIIGFDAVGQDPRFERPFAVRRVPSDPYDGAYGGGWDDHVESIAAQICNDLQYIGIPGMRREARARRDAIRAESPNDEDLAAQAERHRRGAPAAPKRAEWPDDPDELLSLASRARG